MKSDLKMAKNKSKIRLKEIIKVLESWAPPQLQESYDNSGLLVGDSNSLINGVVVCLDCTEDVVAEAVKKKANLIIAHHPILFSGLKSITGKTYVERTLLAAIKKDIAIYAIHTNLDNIEVGVNHAIAKKLNLRNCSVLQPKSGFIKKLSTYVPSSHTESVKNALFTAGAGQIGNYDECSFTGSGTGTFRGNDSTKPFVGAKNVRHHEKEDKIEIILEEWNESSVLSALMKAHPYEEVAYNLYQLDNKHLHIGSGLIGELKNEVEWKAFLKKLKTSMKVKVIRHTNPVSSKVKRIAVCGGSGSFLLPNAIAAQADILITADFKYHQFFDADSRIMIADIGHYESEQFTGELIISYLRDNFPTFALHLTGINTNPVNYY